MATIVNPEENKLSGRVALIVDPTTTENEVLALVERGSISISLNESDNSFDAHSQTDVIENPTTQQGQLELTQARSKDDAALEKLGIRDDLNEGKFIRGENRNFDALEVWLLSEDTPDPSETDVVNRDRVENARVNIGGLDFGDENVTFDLTIKFEPVQDYYIGYEPSA